jgi:lecithin-cholesterol acyltransferase
MASPLSGSITGAAHRYCPHNRTGLFWIDDLLMIPPLFNCVADWIRLTWNDYTNDIEQLSYVQLNSGPIGDVDSVTFVDKFLGFQVVPTYQILANRFLNLGYMKGQDLFGIPYDWRFGLHQKPEFWNNITKLIENAIVMQKAKAALIGHSMGGMFIHHFLTNLTTAEWRSKYIESAVLISPSVGGSGVAFRGLWTGQIPFLSFLGNFTEMMRNLGGIHIHLLNSQIFADTVVYIDEAGNKHLGADIVNLLKNNGKLPGKSEKMFDLYTPYFTTAPTPLDVPVSIVYDSGLKTALTIARSSGKNEFIYGRGDMLVNAEGPEYCCSLWKGLTPIDCLDLKSNGINSNHLTLLWNSKVLDCAVRHAINGTSTQIP